jgi:hypothetical protein
MPTQNMQALMQAEKLLILRTGQRGPEAAIDQQAEPGLTAVAMADHGGRPNRRIRVHYLVRNINQKSAHQRPTLLQAVDGGCELVLLVG